MFKELHVGGLGGIHYELYHPDIDGLFIRQFLEDSKALLSSNALFWSLHLDPIEIEKIIQILVRSNHGANKFPPAYQAISSNPSLFLKEVREATLNLCDQSIGIKKFYKYVEILAVLCQLYSDFKYKPHLLTIYEGFTIFELSSLELYENCLNPIANPYLDFILEHCLPIIERSNPDLVWLNGRMDISLMAIARLVRRFHPNAHISVVGHSSEYYSLNKITKYLLHNDPLFSVIDSIVLDDEEESRHNLIQVLTNQESLDSVSNLIYADREQGEIQIKKTEYKCNSKPLLLKQHATLRNQNVIKKFGIDPSQVANIKLFPENACYWNKCSFCGINKKYHGNLMKNKNWDIDSAIQAFSDLGSKNVKYIWSTDEAIPQRVLYDISQGIIKKKLNIIWQARSRFDLGFLDGNSCESLARSGLREIRFGLESASPRILKLMNKFPDDISLGEIKSIIKFLDGYGISVHCPVIIGYPTESLDDRQYTYNFLKELVRECSNFTYNINIFSLDINSPLFLEWDKHNISAMNLPCLPKYFLGNLVDWDCVSQPFNRRQLEIERNNLMREHLYPWMPPNSLTPPHILYRLTETIRNTLTFKVNNPQSQKVNESFNKKRFKFFNNVVLSEPRQFTNELSQLYNWNNHVVAHFSPDVASFLKKTFSHTHSLDDIEESCYELIIKDLYQQRFVKFLD